MSKKTKKKKGLNRKGFTLIELLAVIAVLSLIFSVVVYSITSIVKAAKEKTYATTINEIEKAAGNYSNEKNAVSFVTLPGSNDTKEYRCVRVKDLIEYGFLDNTVTNSLVADNVNVSVNDFVYLVRNTKNKTIVQKNYVSEDNDICINNQQVNGSVVFLSSPGWNSWAKEKKITIKYKIGNSWNASAKNNYVYSYKYQVGQNIVAINNDVGDTQASLTVNEPGTISGKIFDIINERDSGVNSHNVTNIDKDGPVISLLDKNDTVQYVSNSVDVKLKVTDCEDGNCSGLNNIDNEEALRAIVSSGNLTVTVNNRQIKTIKLTYVSPGIYNLRINNKTENGPVAIYFKEGSFYDTVVDEVKNTNVDTLLPPNIVFDNSPLQIEVNNTNEPFVESQIATLVCRDNNSDIKYYIGKSEPTTSSTYVSMNTAWNNVFNKHVGSINKTIGLNDVGAYYFSCKESTGKVTTVKVDYWKYNVKGYLNTIDGSEGVYTTENYEKVAEGSFIGPDGMIIPFLSLLRENDVAKTYIKEGSNADKYLGFSVGEASKNTSATIVHGSGRLDSNITYCMWFKRNKVNIGFNTNGGELDSNNDSYTATSDGIILKNGSSTIQSIKYGGQLKDTGLMNWNNDDYISISRLGYTIDTNQWICLSGCSTTGKTFNQTTQYMASSFCNASQGDCSVILGANWQLFTYNAQFDTKGGVPSIPDKNNVKYSDSIEIPTVTKKVKFVPQTNSNLPSNCSNPTITPSSGKEYNLTLVGWHVGDAILKGNRFSDLTNKPGTTVNLVAEWEVFNESLVLPTVTRSECDCGWDTKSGSNEKVYDSGGIYTGTINPNGSAQNGVMTIKIYPVCKRADVHEPRCYYNYQNASDSKNGNLYYITTCGTTSCNYTQLNGVAQNGTVNRENLTADLSKCNYTVTYDCKTNGGGSNFTETYNYTQTPDLSKKTCSKSGWMFVGWNTTSSAHTKVTSITKKPQTLYAIYKKEITATYNDEGYGLSEPEGINLSSYSNVSFSCSNNKCTSACTLYNKDTKCTGITPNIVYSSKKFFSTSKTDYSKFEDSTEFIHAYENATFNLTVDKAKNYYVPHDNINNTRYNCFKYKDGDGKERYRLSRFHISTCDGQNCEYTRINGMTESGTVARAGLRVNLSDNLNCASEYYLTKDEKCYPSTSSSGNPSTTVKAGCTKLSLYRTTTKIPRNGNGSDSWYYISDNNCYVSGANMTSAVPSSCYTPTSSSNTTSSTGTGQYHVTICSGGGVLQSTWTYGCITVNYQTSFTNLRNWVNSHFYWTGYYASGAGGYTYSLGPSDSGKTISVNWVIADKACYLCETNTGYSWYSSTWDSKICKKSVKSSNCN